MRGPFVLSFLLASVASVASVASLGACAAPAGGDVAKAASDPLDVDADAVVGVSALNLRAGPAVTFDVLAVMPEGARVHVTGASENGFAPVTYGDLSGGAFAGYLAPAPPPPPPPAPVALGSLADAVAALAAEANARSPGTELGVAVKDLTTGEYEGAGDDVRHVSASAAKPIWVAAAIHAGAAVGDIAGPIFRSSDNDASGTAIDRAGGADAVNAFMWDVVGMDASLLANWSFGARRVATNQGVLGGDNYFTARDVVTFLAKLDDGTLLGDRTGELETYMTWTPRSGYGGWMGTLLPDDVRASMMHKAGWLPPPDYAAYSTLNEIGVVQVPGGDRYAVALLAHHGRSYALEESFVERASCVIYRTVAQDPTVGCRD